MAGSELAHGITTEHVAAAILGFVVSTIAVVAWINFTWFASALDNDDWLSGSPLSVCILLVLASPIAIIIGYELAGWRLLEDRLAAAHRQQATTPPGPY